MASAAPKATETPAPPPPPAPAPPAPVEKTASTEPPAPAKSSVKRTHDGAPKTIVRDEQEDPLVRHLKSIAPEPMDSTLESQSFTHSVRPDLDGLFEIINSSLARLHNAFSFVPRPCTTGQNDQTNAWLGAMEWACLRELLLTVEFHEARFLAPRAKPTHNRLLVPLEAAYAIQSLRPVEIAGSPKLFIDYRYLHGEVTKRYPAFRSNDVTMLERHQSLVVFFQSKRLTTLSFVNFNWEKSLINTGVVTDVNQRAYISREKLTWIDMLFALKLAFFQVRSINGVVFVPLLTGQNAIVAPHLTVHNRGDFYDFDAMWRERITGPLSMQSKV